MKTIKKSEFRELLKTKSLREIGKIYGVTYERVRQIAVMWDLNRRSWQKIKLIDDEIKIKGIIECKKRGDKKRENELWKELLENKK